MFHLLSKAFDPQQKTILQGVIAALVFSSFVAIAYNQLAAEPAIENAPFLFFKD